MTNTNFGKSYPGNFRASWMYERKPWVRPAVEADTSDVVLAELRETTAQLEALAKEDLRRYEGTAHADPIAHKQRMEHARRAVVHAAQAAEERRILAAGARKPPAWDPLGMAEFAWFLGEPGPKPPPPPTRSERARDLLVTGVTRLINAGVALLAWLARAVYRLFLNRIFAWVLTMLGIAYGVVDLAFGHFLLGPITIIGWSMYFIVVMSHKSNTKRPNHRLGTARVEHAAPKAEVFTVPCKGGCGRKLLAGSRPMCMTCRDRVDRERKMRGGISEYQARALEEAKQSKCTDCGEPSEGWLCSSCDAEAAIDMEGY